jgi:zinc finger protein 423
MNAVKKINSLLQSGTVSVSGPSVQNRVYNKPNTVINRQSAALTSNVTITATNSHHVATKEQVRCFVCDEIVITGSLGSNTLVADAILAPSSTKLSSKIARIVGDGFMVIIGIEDIVCRRCMQMFNQMDRLETDLERVRNNIKNLLHKKYNINDEESLFSPTPAAVPAPIIKKQETHTPPPVKMQKLNTGQVTYTTLKQNSYAAEQTSTPTTTMSTPQQNSTTIRKLNLPLNSKDAIENQMTNMFETSNNNVSTTATTPTVNQQTKPQVVGNTITTLATAPATNAAAVVGNKRAPIKMYKCMQCEFRTTDLSLFTPHYEKCKPRRNALPARVPTNTMQVTQSAKVGKCNNGKGQFYVQITTFSIITSVYFYVEKLFDFNVFSKMEYSLEFISERFCTLIGLRFIEFCETW